MYKRIIAMMLTLATLLGMLAVPASAASTLEEAMAEVDIYAKGEELVYLTMNGQVKGQHYTYYNYTSVQTGETTEIPAYCVDPRLYGVPSVVPEGTAVKYSSDGKNTDPKIMGIIANGYPHMSLDSLGLNSIEEAYYATKTALWCYLLGTWSVSGLGINPSLTGADKTAAERVLKATKDIYTRGMYWSQLVEPKMTAVPDRDEAYPVTINGEACYQQVYTLKTETWSITPINIELAAGAPAGTKIMDMDNHEISSMIVTTAAASGTGFEGQFKVVFPASSVEGQEGTAQINLSSTVVQYEIYYARSLETDKYGNIQDYMLDTDPHIPITANAIARFSSEHTDETELLIVKLEEGTRIPLEGAVFDVFSPDGDRVGRYSTDTSGKIRIPLVITGNYTVKEVSAPAYHLLPTDNTHNITVEHGKTATLTVTNAPYGSLRVLKRSDMGEGLAGVNIEIRNVVTGETRTGRTGPGGVVEFTELSVGAWEVRETAGVPGYVVDTDSVKNVSVVAGECATVTFINKEKPGLRIVKYDSQTMRTMPDVTFRIYRDTELFGEYVTDQMGEIVLTDLEPGVYLVQEVSADPSHIVNSTPQEVKLEAGYGIVELVFLNDQKPGIRLKKVDSVTYQPQANARFRIEAVGGTFSKEYYTDANGEIDLKDLEPGSFKVTELQAPDGYLIDDATRVIKIEANEQAVFVFTNTRKPSFELVKLDPAGNPVVGATFRIAKIEDGNHYLDRVTDTQGKIRIDGMEPGIYSVQEMSVPSPYILNSTEFHVELFPGRVSELVVTNDRKPDLKIVKTDAITGTPIEGATFTIRKVDSSTLITETTNAAGEILLREMEPGVYEVTEQSVPDAYLLDPRPQQITLFPNKLGIVQFQDYKKPSLKILKVDSATGKPVEGARFHIVYASNHTFTGEINDLGTHYTDANGVIYLDKLKDGWYRATEEEAPAGYRIKDTGVYEFYIEAGRDKVITVENVPLSTIVIQKIDEETGKPLQGAWFRMSYLNSLTSMDGTTIGEWPTDENGQIEVRNLDEGTYLISELSAPQGYVLNPANTRTVYLAGDKQDFVTVTYGNQHMGALLIQKKDAVTGEPLAGVEFSVTDSNGSVVGNGNGRFVTDFAGTITIANLEPGKTVIVKETRTVPGYILDDTAQTIKIKANETMTVEFRNQPKGGLVIRKLDSVTNQPIAGVEFQITNTAGEYVADNEGRTSTNGIYRTDSYGEIRLLDLMPDSYTAVEVSTVAGYAINSTPQTTKVGAADTQTLTYLNDPLQTLVVQKYIAGTQKGLAGVTFLITDGAGTPIGGSNGEYVTDANGRITITGLTPGMTVVVREVRTVRGYVLNTQPQTIIIGKASGQTTVSGCTTTATVASAASSSSSSESGNEVVFYDDPLGRLVVEKYIEGTSTPIPGVRFLITGSNGGAVGNTNGEYTTDANGRIEIRDLEPGLVVTAKEIHAADGFVLDSTPKSIEIKSGDTQVLTFYNQPTGSLRIIKKDRVTGALLRDAEFEISFASGGFVGNNGGTTTSNGVYTTNEKGEILITGLQPSVIEVRETRAPDGYSLSASPVTVEVAAGDAQTVTVYDDPLGSLIIQKYVDGGTTPIPNVRFLVTKGDGSPIGNGEYVTDANGRIEIKNLQPGMTVSAKELRAADGFVLDGTPQSTEIKSGAAQQLTFYNKATGSLVIVKRDRVSNELLQGAEFLVMTDAGEYVANNGGATSSNGVYVTDDKGQIVISGLQPCSLVVKETKAPANHVLDSSPRTVRVNAGDTQTLTVYNDPCGTLKIIKRDRATGAVLKGAEFELCYASGEFVGNLGGSVTSNGRYVTDERGEIVITGLQPSTIVIRELRAPEGYLLDNSPVTVEVKANDCQTIDIYNDATQVLTIQKFITDTTKPIAGVSFLITDSSGKVLGPNNGIYTTDKDGRITLTGLTPGTVITAKETKTAAGFVLDTTPQSIEIRQGEAQTMTFYNTPEGGLEIIKVSSADKTKRLSGVTFEIRRMDDGLVDTVTTGDNGRVHVALDAGNYYAVEIEGVKGFKVDSTPHYFTVKDGENTTLTVQNTPYSGIELHKIDSVTGKGIYGAKFLLYDAEKHPVGEYVTDQNGYIYIDDLTRDGKYFIRELECEGYNVDTQIKTVVVKAGEVIQIEWKNTPITGQIQVYKYAAEYNPVTFTAAGSPLAGAVFEIVEVRSGKVVDYITTDARGVAASKPLPLRRYQVKEVTAPAYWQIDPTVHDVTLEYPSQIIKVSSYDKSAQLGVSITKRGNAQVQAGEQMRYTITVANTSNVPLEDFFWHDRIPTDVATAMTLTTGTYSARLTYRILYKTSGNNTYQVLASNLVTTNNYSFSLNAIPTQAGGRVTDVYFDFGKVPVGFQSVASPTLTVCVDGNAANNYSMINRAETGGKYGGTWETATASWTTVIINLNKPPKLPKTGY